MVKLYDGAKVKLCDGSIVEMKHDDRNLRYKFKMSNQYSNHRYYNQWFTEDGNGNHGTTVIQIIE